MRTKHEQKVLSRQLQHQIRQNLPLIGTSGPFSRLPWRNDEVFNRLDISSFMGRTVFELGSLSDKEMKRQLAGATGLLFPSFVEGFGLPPFEATAYGIPTIASPLRTTEIHLGDMPIYADPTDMYQWFTAIRELASENLAEQTQRHTALRAYRLPSWEKHFDRVFDLI